jgi:hypothetical protein
MFREERLSKQTEGAVRTAIMAYSGPLSQDGSTRYFPTTVYLDASGKSQISYSGHAADIAACR